MKSINKLISQIQSIKINQRTLKKKIQHIFNEDKKEKLIWFYRKKLNFVNIKIGIIFQKSIKQFLIN